jgi:hypothetical protein
LHVVEPIHPGDAVADREDLSDLRDLRLAAEIRSIAAPTCPIFRRFMR